MTDPRAALEGELAELRAARDGTSEARRPVVLDQQSVGRLSRMDAIQNQAMAAGEEARRSARITVLEAALARVDAGTWGLCVDCEEPVEPARLAFDPATPLCLDCRRG